MSELGLNIIGAAAKQLRGRPSEHCAIGTPSPLTDEDLDHEVSSPQAEIVKLRNSHHRVARLLAQKENPVEVARQTGYTTVRIHQLQNDPAFKELLAHYEKVEYDSYTDYREQMAMKLSALGHDTLETLHEKLLTEGDKFSAKELKDILTVVLDRSGFGPSSTVNDNKSLNVNIAVLERIKSAPSAPVSLREEDHSALLRLAVSATDASAAAEALAGEQGEGSGVREEGPALLLPPEARGT